MGRKISNPKLLKKTEGGSMSSAFNQFANKLAQAKRKKIEKVGDTKQRLMQAKRTNKMLKVSKRTSKFALLEDQPAQGLTHRGQKITDLKEFNDINFGSDDDDEQFQEMHDKLNFTGFDEEEEKPKDDRPKSKTEIYKEIIEKSKMHKHLRQELYEENLEKANQLDEQFPELTSKLQFRTRDSNVKDRLASQDHEFQKLMNELRDDQKVVSNKVMQKSEKYTDKVRQKKTQQLNALLKDSSDDEADIRTWVKTNKKQQEEQEEEEDQLDEVQLSSGEEDQEDEEGQDGEEDDEEEDDDDEEQDGQDVEELSGSEGESEQQDEDEESEQEEEEEEESPAPPAKTIKNKGISKAQPKQAPQKSHPQKPQQQQRKNFRK